MCIVDVCDVLVKLDDEILSDESKWCKYALVNQHGQVCLLGGITKAVYGNARSLPWNSMGKSADRDDLIYRQVVEVIRSETHGSTISFFNDAFDIRFEDVKALIKRARQKVCAQ